MQEPKSSHDFAAVKAKWKQNATKFGSPLPGRGTHNPFGRRKTTGMVSTTDCAAAAADAAMDYEGEKSGAALMKEEGIDEPVEEFEPAEDEDSMLRHVTTSRANHASSKIAGSGSDVGRRDCAAKDNPEVESAASLEQPRQNKLSPSLRQAGAGARRAPRRPTRRKSRPNQSKTVRKSLTMRICSLDKRKTGGLHEWTATKVTSPKQKPPLQSQWKRGERHQKHPQSETNSRLLYPLDLGCWLRLTVENRKTGGSHGKKTTLVAAPKAAQNQAT